MKKDSTDMLRVKITLLETVRTSIVQRGRCHSLCAELLRCTVTQPDRIAAYLLRDYIMQAIFPCAYIEEWSARERARRGLPARTITEKQEFKLRVSWIDWMLQCLREDLAEREN
jgi:hypothetical protein